MIKIELNSEKKSKIEDIFLSDVFDEIKSNNKSNIIKILDQKDIQLLLETKFCKLYDFFYDKNKKIRKDEVRKLLLADRKQMVKFINVFGKYNRENKKEKELSDILLNRIFLYKNFATRKAAYNISSILGVTVCPYCNRSYIVTLKKSKVRPQFDHYYPKVEYPYLALSLYNMIPCCSICNMAKSDMDTKEKPILYPYEEEFSDNIKFTIDYNDKSFVKVFRGISNDFEIKINNTENILQEKVRNQIDKLHITELYNEHKDYIMDIYKSYYINSNERVEELLKQLPDLFSSEEDVRSLMFMSNIQKENWGKRPLAKLTHDIYCELERMRES